MAPDRLRVVLIAMAETDAANANSPIDQVCAVAVDLLALRGAGISLMVDGELCGTAGVSDPGIAAVQELQLTLGEGPCVDAWATGAPVLESNLAAPTMVRWPAFSPGALEAGVRAVFAFPMHLGAARIGILVLYRDRIGELRADELAYGLVLADVATQTVLGLQAGADVDALHSLLANEPAHWAEIHQATGITAAALEVSLDEAFVRLRAHSYADGRPLRSIARDIVSGALRLAHAVPRSEPGAP